MVDLINTKVKQKNKEIILKSLLTKGNIFIYVLKDV